MHILILIHSTRQVLPISFFERHNNAFYNSIVVSSGWRDSLVVLRLPHTQIIDTSGEILGIYRKSHVSSIHLAASRAR